jgi:fructokinase
VTQPPPGAVLVLGEALIDLVPQETAGGRSRRYAAEPGGAPVNVAVGLAVLGTPCWFAGAFGGDAFAADLERVLVEAGADVGLSARSPLPTTLAVTEPGPHGTAYHFHLADTATFLMPDLSARAGEFAAVYAGGLAAVVPPAADAVAGAAHAAAASSVLVVDPNVRTDRTLDPAASRGRLRELCLLARVLKVSDEDLVALWPGEEPEAVCERLASGGRLVLLTRGAAGSVAFTASGERVHRPAEPVEVVNTIGAGDAFVAAAVHALAGVGALGDIAAATRAQASDVMEFASRVAASVVASPGTAPTGPARLTGV